MLAPVNHRVGLDATNANSDTALHLAVKVGDLEIASQLLEAGSDAGAEDADGRTVLQAGAYNEQQDLVVIFKGYGRDRVLEAQEPGPVSMLSGHERARSPRTDLESRNQEGYTYTPLEQAVLNGDLDTVRELLESGADVNAMIGGRVDLHLATEQGNTEIVEMEQTSNGKIWADVQRSTWLQHAGIQRLFALLLVRELVRNP